MDGSRVRRLVWVVALVASVAAVTGVGWALLSRPRVGAPAPEVSTGTAAVTRGTVTERVQLAGVLGYDGSYPVAHHGASGIVTSVAEPGALVGRGGVLYAVANRPVRLLLGALPVYRDFAAGMPDGPDVRQLEENLVALGLDPARQVRVDQRFTTGTAAAIRRWQAAWGLPATSRSGALPLGAVVFAPVALRVTEVQAVVGAVIGPDAPVLSATSITRVITAQLTTDRQSLVHAGDEVLVSISGTGPPAASRVLRVGRIATAPEDQAPAVTVTVAVNLVADVPDLDQAPAQVSITAATHENVLQVPVIALLPAPGGGYQVRLADGGYVPVRPGLFDSTEGTVEVTGALSEGQLVQVPIP
jgi:peptidoglycan hydrolase-like protein with peptidoglycan-binding domain